MKKEIKLNFKGPRMRKAKYWFIIFNKQLFKEFKESHPDYKDLTWKEFQQRWGDITETIRYETVMNPLGVKLPQYLGELKYQFLPYKLKVIDKNTTEKEGNEIYHMNIVTRGKQAKIKWERRFAVNYFRMLQFYAFKNDRGINKLTRDYTLDNPEKIRIARTTMGGRCFWCNKK